MDDSGLDADRSRRVYGTRRSLVGRELGMKFEVVSVKRGLDGQELYLHCRSDTTRALPARNYEGASRGTAVVERLANLNVSIDVAGSKAETLIAAQGVAKQNLVFGDGWTALKWRDFRISFDRCASWRSFEAARMLAPHVAGASGPAYFELYTKEPIEYQDLKVDLRGGDSGEPRVAFIVRSKALIGSGARRVESVDGGRTWSIRNEESPWTVEPERVRMSEIALARDLKFTLVQVRGRTSPGQPPRFDQFVVCESGSTRATRPEFERGVPANATLVGELTYTGFGPSPPQNDGALEWWMWPAREALALGPGWVAWKRDTLRVSLDDCATWRTFMPWKAIAPQEIVHDKVSSRCSDEGCAQASFQNRRLPEYKDLSVARGARAGEGSIAFTLQLETLDAGGERKVWSSGLRRSWTLRRPGPP